MANRILRDWTASESIDNLSPEAEVFFTRLIMKADDYGSFHANPKLLKAALFPLKEYKDATISKWTNECIEAGLIFPYSNGIKEFIRIKNFGQRLRNMRSTFPQPDDNAQQSAASRRESPPETKRNETESETETKSLREPVKDIFLGEDVQAAWEEWVKYKTEKRQKLTPSTEKKQMQFLGGRAGPEAIAIIHQSITNGWTGLFELKQNGNRNTTQASVRRSDAVIQTGRDFGEL